MLSILAYLEKAVIRPRGSKMCVAPGLVPVARVGDLEGTQLHPRRAGRAEEYALYGRGKRHYPQP